MSARQPIFDFQLANPLYKGATVSIYEVVSDVATSNLATLYAGPSGSETLSNPVKLDSRGKQKQAIYVDSAVVADVASVGVPRHTTGIISGLTDALVTFTQDGTGAVARTVQDKLLEVVSIKDFGALGDGVTNDDTARQKALDAVGAAGGGLVYAPAGTYITATASTVAYNGTGLKGAGMYATKFRHSNANSGTFRVTADVDYFEFSDFTVDHSGTATAGFVFQTETSGILGGKIERVRTSGVYGVAKNTITSGSVNNVTLKDCICLATVQYGIWLQYTTDWRVENCVIEGATRTAGTVGIMAESSNDGLYTDALLVLNFGTGMECQSSVGGSASRHFFMEQTSFDGAGTYCVEISALLRSQFVSCWFASVYGTCGGVNMNGASAYGLEFTACRFLNLAGHGALIQGGASEIDFTACHFCDWGVAAAATYSGIISSANAATKFSVNGCKFYADSDFSGNPWRGIVINSGSYADYQIHKNTFTGMTGASIVDSGTCSIARVMDNTGYNPGTPVSAVAGTSPYTYTAGHAPESVYIASGTVSAIAVGGVTVYTATDKFVHLYPNQAVIITWSVVPTVTRILE